MIMYTIHIVHNNKQMTITIIDATIDEYNKSYKRLIKKDNKENRIKKFIIFSKNS